jgi:hypothetical protein
MPSIINASTSGAGGVVTTADASGELQLQTASATRMTITSSGNVGIGTSSPTSRLHVAASGYPGAGVYRALDVGVFGAVSQRIEIGALNGSTFTPGAAIDGQLDNPSTTGLLSFSTRSSNTLTERMRINSAGNVGIGTSSPGARLHLTTSVGVNAASDMLRLSSVDGDPSVYVGLQAQRDNASGQGLNIQVTNVFGTIFEAARITPAGNVGIGTSSPDGTLHVQTFTTNNAIFQNAAHNTLTNLSTALTFSRSDGINNLAAIFGWNAGGLALAGREGIAFATGGDALYNSTIERMRIDSSGNVGIGTSSPAQRLDISGNASVSGQLMAGTTTTYSDGTIGTPRLQWRAQAGAYAGAISIADTTNGIEHWVLRNPNGSVASVSTNGSSFVFNTAHTERMRIDSSGNLLVGKTTTASDVTTIGAFITNVGKSVFTTSSGASLVLAGTGTGTRNIQDFYLNGNFIGAISVSTSAVSYNTTSDYRLKENIVPMSGALNVVALLKPVTYNWKADGSDGQGFIAHELQEVVPDCVTGEKDAVDEKGNPQYQGIDTSFLVATLTAAIQEQQAIITDLKARIEVLEGASA